VQVVGNCDRAIGKLSVRIGTDPAVRDPALLRPTVSLLGKRLIGHGIPATARGSWSAPGKRVLVTERVRPSGGTRRRDWHPPTWPVAAIARRSAAPIPGCGAFSASLSLVPRRKEAQM